MISFFIISLSFLPFFLIFYPLSLLISFPLSFSPLELFLIWVWVLVIFVDSKFVSEFIAWVMLILLVHSTCQSVFMYARSYVPWMSQWLSKACVRVSVVLHLKPFLSQVNRLLRFLTVRPWNPLSSLEPLPVVIQVPKQEGLVVY